MTNWKKFKIIGKETCSVFNSISFELDNYVPRINMRILNDILCVNSHPFDTWQVGDYLEIDIDETVVKYKVGGCFEDTSMVRKFGSSAVVSRNNSNLTTISQSQASGAIQMLNRAIDSDERNKYTASIEINPSNGNVSYHLSGQRK